MIFLTLLAIVLILLVTLFILVGIYIFKSTAIRKLRNIDESYNRYVEKKIFDKELYDSLKKEDVTLKSFDGLNLVSTLIMNEKPSNKFIILAHGISICYVGSLKYFDIFYRHGFNVLIINQRRHGKSEGKYSSFGFFEKYDLNMWIEYLKKRFGNNIVLGLHGESMGSGTVMETLPLNDSIKFAIVDCGYSNVYELIKFQITNEYKNKFIRTILTPGVTFANWFMILKAKFSIKKIIPLDIVSKTSVPMMFIHGKEDYFVPWYMSIDLYNSKIHGYRELYLVEGATHAESLELNKPLYEEKVIKFIKKVLLLQGIEL